MSNFKDYDIQIEGMSCASCTATIRDQLLHEFPTQIKQLSIDLLSKNAKIKTTLLPQVVAKAIQDYGFTVTHISHSTKKITLARKTPMQEARPILLRGLFNLLIGLPLMVVCMLGLLPSVTLLAGQIFAISIGLLALLSMLITAGKDYKKAGKLLRKGIFNMDTLMSISTWSTWIFSILAAFFPLTFPSSILQIDFASIFIILGIVYLGRGIKNYFEKKTHQSILSLEEVIKNSLPMHTTILINNESVLIPSNEVQLNDNLIIYPQEKIPVDGILESLDGCFNEVHLTGEEKPSAKTKGQMIYAGSVNLGAEIKIKARSGLHNGTKFLSRAEEIFEKLQSAKTTLDGIRTSKTIQKIARWFVPTILIIAVGIALLWLFLGPAPSYVYALSSFVSLLLCACPCGLGLAFPIPASISIHQSIKKGVLFHKAESLETIQNIDTFVFDKTGTLTSHQGKIVQTLLFEEQNPLETIASLEACCEHPIAKVFVEAAKKQSLTLQEFQKTQFDGEGRGLQGKLGNDIWRVGSPKYLQNQESSIDAATLKTIEAWKTEGLSIVAASKNNKIVAVYGILFPLQHDAHSTLNVLKKLKKRIILLTGDHQQNADKLAKELPFIDEVYAGKNPDQKAEVISTLLSHGYKIAMVGDGLNDTLAMQASSSSIALGFTQAGSVADITVKKLSLIPEIIKISHTTLKNVKQNLAWTFGYNLISILLAAGILFPLSGLMLNPLVASILMAISSIVVLLNASRLNSQLNSSAYPQNKSMLRQFWHQRTTMEKALILNFGLFTVLSVAGIICSATCGIPLSLVFSSMSISMGLAGCFCSLTFLTGIVGLGAILMMALAYQTVKICQQHGNLELREKNKHQSYAAPAVWEHGENGGSTFNCFKSFNQQNAFATKNNDDFTNRTSISPKLK